MRPKPGHPTMGGLLILTASLVPTLLWADLRNIYIWIAVLATAAFGGIGFFDDYLKIVRRSHHGLMPRYKLAGQFSVALAVGITLIVLAGYNMYSTRLIFPFFKNLIPDLGWWYVPLTILVLVGWSNAVNLTDGLDGLAISTFAISAAAFTALAYVTGHRVLAEYLLLVHFQQSAELTIFCGSLVGASLGFLWYNSYPAEIFMGDVGSLALGGALGTVALLIKQEILLHIVGRRVRARSGVGDHPGRIVQVDRETRVQDGAAAPSLRADWLERAEGDRTLHHRRDHLRALQPDDVETEMSFSVLGQNVTVVGAARSGIAAALLLTERGARVTLTDSRPELEEAAAAALRLAGVRLELGGHRLETFESADLLVLSPGVPLEQPPIAAARDAGVPIIGEIELASRWLSGRIVAITGTKGKSTTTTLAGRMFDAGGLKAIVGGNIGTPLSSQVAVSTPETFHIVEVSSFQLETIETLSSMDRGSPESVVRPSRPSWFDGGVCGREGQDFRQPDSKRTLRSSTPTIRRRSPWRAGLARRRSRFPSARPSCRFRQFDCSAGISSAM